MDIVGKIKDTFEDKGNGWTRWDILVETETEKYNLKLKEILRVGSFNIDASSVKKEEIRLITGITERSGNLNFTGISEPLTKEQAAAISDQIEIDRMNTASDRATVLNALKKGVN